MNSLFKSKQGLSGLKVAKVPAVCGAMLLAASSLQAAVTPLAPLAALAEVPSTLMMFSGMF